MPSKIRRKARGPNFCDLPNEVLEKIVGNVNIWHHNRIRESCKRLRDIDDCFIMHEYKKALNKSFKNNPTGHTYAVLKVSKYLCFLSVKI